MAESKIRLCNVLCFIANKFSHTAVKTMKTVLSDFYSSEELAVAKILLMEDIDKLNLDTKRPHVPLRRDGDGRLAREVDDILSLFTFIDEQKLMDQLPVYVSDSPDNMPSIRLYDGDLLVLNKWMKSVDEKMHALEVALAGVTTDLRKTQASWPCLPDPSAYRQPQPRVQSANTVYTCESQSARQPAALSSVSLTAGNSTATSSSRAPAVSVSTVPATATSSWATMTSSPFADKNRYDLLGSTTDDDGCNNEQQQPFTIVRPRRQKRSFQARSPPAPETNATATGQLAKSLQQRRAPLLRGKSTAGSTISAAERRQKKVVLCIDNVTPTCTADDMSAFISGLSVNVVSCFEAKTRRRRGDTDESETCRKAFRVCVHDNDLERLLKDNLWPESITISEWFFKPAPPNPENTNDKRTRVDSECLSHETRPKTLNDQHNTAADIGTEEQPSVTDNDTTVVVNYDDNNMDCLIGGNDGV